MFLCKIFFSSSTESSWTKRWSVLNEKRCRVKCFHKNSCFSCLYWKYLQKRTPNRNLVGTKLNVFFWVISFSAYLLPIDAHISSTSISATSISKKKKKKKKTHSDFKLRRSMKQTKNSCLCSAGTGEGGGTRRDKDGGWGETDFSFSQYERKKSWEAKFPALIIHVHKMQNPEYHAFKQRCAYSGGSMLTQKRVI